MDSRAKQRLTGAVILAALFVLLVPELLTGPKAPSAPAAPEEEEGLRSYTIDIDGKSPGAAPPATSPVPVTPAATPAESRASSPPVSAPAPAVQPSQPEQPEPRVVVEAAPAAPSATQSATQSAPASTTAAPVRPAPTAPAQPAATQVARGSFVVQLGSFGSRDNADRLVRDMSARGFKAFVAPIRSGGRDLYRVRVGPAPDRASAEALAADLKRIGQSGSIVPIS